MNKYSKYLLLAILLFILLRVPSLFEGFWYGDEGLYATQAEGILRGRQLYSQVWDHKPPLLVWIYLIGGMFGWDTGYPLVKILSILSGIVSIIFVDKILIHQEIKKKLRITALFIFSLLLSTPIFEGNIANAEVFFIPLNLAIVYLTLSSRRPLAVAGFLVLTFLIKPQSFAEAIAVIGASFLFDLFKGRINQEFKYYLKVFLYFLSLVSIYILFLLYSGSLNEFVDAAFVTNFLYVGGGNNNTFLKAIVIFSVVCIALYLLKKGRFRRSAFILTINMVSSLFLVTLSGRPYPHYAIQLLPIVTLSGSVLLNVERLKRTTKVLTIVTFLFFCGIFFRPQPSIIKFDRVEPYIRYYSDFLRYAILDDHSTKSYFWRNHVSNSTKREFYNYFNENYPQTTYYYYGEESWIFTQIDANFTNKYLVWYHLTFTEDKLKEALLHRDQAELVIVDDNSPVALEGFFHDFEEKFTLIDEYRNYLIYAKN